MEDNFGAFLIQVARNCGTRYRCLYGGGTCGAIFHTEDEMVQHLGRAELDGGHETEMLNTYRNFNVILAAARPPATSYAKEASIGRAISAEEMEGFNAFISRIARNSGIEYTCPIPNCGPIFRTEDEMNQYVHEIELFGGHEPQMCHIHNNLNEALITVPQDIGSGTPDTRECIKQFDQEEVDLSKL